MSPKKNKRNKIAKNKIFLWIILSVFLICMVGYYAEMYISTNQIVFTSSDVSMLIILGSAILVISILVIYLVFKVNKINTQLNIVTEKLLESNSLILDLKNDIIEFQDILIDEEDNNVKQHRTTQLILMNLSKKLGVWSDETRC